MNRADAKIIAQTITNQQLSEMFNAASIGITDWTQISLVNKGMTKGAAWNILASNFDVEGVYNIMGKINMIREFGAFLPQELKPKHNKKNKNELIVFHQTPIFKNEIDNQK